MRKIRKIAAARFSATRLQDFVCTKTYLSKTKDKTVEPYPLICFYKKQMSECIISSFLLGCTFEQCFEFFCIQNVRRLRIVFDKV